MSCKNSSNCGSENDIAYTLVVRNERNKKRPETRPSKDISGEIIQAYFAAHRKRQQDVMQAVKMEKEEWFTQRS